MAETKTMTKAHTEAAPVREEVFRLPRVDIYETDGELVLLADMPGVGEKAIQVSIEEDRLEIIGRLDKPATQGGEMLYAESELLPFRREFFLEGDIQRDGIEGKIQNGVLRLVLPKGEGARVRKIPIKT